VIKVARNVSRVAVRGVACDVGEGVPDGDTAAALVNGAFDLVGGDSAAPEEVLGKAVGVNGHGGDGSGERGGQHAGEAGSAKSEAGSLEEFTSVHEVFCSRRVTWMWLVWVMGMRQRVNFS
jgi:hypothetical protein